MAKQKEADLGSDKELKSEEVLDVTPVTSSDTEKPKGKELKIKKKNIIGDRYLLVEKKKYIVEASGTDAEEFSGIHPPKVVITGKEGQYFDFKGTRYLKFRGRCGEVVELDQYQYNALKSSTRPSQKRVKTENGYAPKVIRKRNWSLEEA